MLTQLSAQLEQKAQELKDYLLNKLNSFPQNHRIQQLSPKCFVLQFRDLENNWSPNFHDHRWQYETISQECTKRDAVTLIPFLKDICNKGKLRVGQCDCRLHPDVISNLQGILDD